MTLTEWLFNLLRKRGINCKHLVTHATYTGVMCQGCGKFWSWINPAMPPIEETLPERYRGVQAEDWHDRVERVTKLSLVLAVLLMMVSVCHADPIPFGNYITTNDPGGTVSYLQAIGGSSVSGSGSGWLFQTGIGLGVNIGSLNVTTSQFSLEGELSRVYFNVKTGLLQAQFEGKLRWPGGGFSVYHAVFYESVDLANKTTRGGHVIISEAPEPSTIWLMISGALGVAVRMKWKLA